MASKAYEQYGVPLPPEDPTQDYMTVQETAYVLNCSVSWLRRFLKDNRHLHSYSGRRIVTDRQDRAAIYETRRAGDPRQGRTIPRQRRQPAARKPALAGS
ncbi:DNA-binding protein [Streptomyces sp. ActVer]|uniref:DNA-binding protein n=1 Tax=Streptomyces sp. ActVer TaxID=3014558 RepID=UPI0022B44747|nr:DNA-binding protein [Streptomyces sp. ActVer]MCZ4509910.1 DNA-binding protein [Streptomyces sp. ActVer]